MYLSKIQFLSPMSKKQRAKEALSLLKQSEDEIVEVLPAATIHI